MGWSARQGAQESRDGTDSNTLRSSSRTPSNPPRDVRTLPASTSRCSRRPHRPARLRRCPPTTRPGRQGEGECWGKAQVPQQPSGASQTRRGFLTKEATPKTPSRERIPNSYGIKPTAPADFPQPFAVNLARQTALGSRGAQAPRVCRADPVRKERRARAPAAGSLSGGRTAGAQARAHGTHAAARPERGDSAPASETWAQRPVALPPLPPPKPTPLPAGRPHRDRQQPPPGHCWGQSHRGPSSPPIRRKCSAASASAPPPHQPPTHPAAGGPGRGPAPWPGGPWLCGHTSAACTCGGWKGGEVSAVKA